MGRFADAPFAFKSVVPPVRYTPVTGEDGQRATMIFFHPALRGSAEHPVFLRSPVHCARRNTGRSGKYLPASIAHAEPHSASEMHLPIGDDGFRLAEPLIGSRSG